ncbi:MAG: hypothetical protein HUK21_02955 [Fibrobacteraceae bacterium]|nr:hypothetical protein [Fibrobacteraceae bacterium]
MNSEIIFENLKELVKAKNAAHESMFKLHWKKMWPFNLIWPQVDYIRIVRFMGEIQQKSEEQKSLVQQALAKAEPIEKPFLKTVPAYLDALKDSCQKLSKVAQWKQDLLEKKIKRDVFQFNSILKDYEKSQADLVRAGAFVQTTWLDIAPKGEQK